METEPQSDLRVREAMEACRPAHDDLAEPELAFLAKRLETDPALAQQFRRQRQFDQSLADAFRDVAIPEGLADRILARLASATGDSDVPGERPTPAPAAETVAPGHRFSRRWLLVGAGSIVAAAVVLVIVSTQATRPLPFEGPDAVAQTAIEFYGRDAAEVGQTVEDVAPPRDYPFAAEVVATSGIRWRWVRGFLGRVAVAYELTGPGGERATLYVVLGAAQNIPGEPSSQPFITQGCAASAWQTGNCLYVFVVNGGRQTYKRLLVAPREPLA